MKKSFFKKCLDGLFEDELEYENLDDIQDEVYEDEEPYYEDGEETEVVYSDSDEVYYEEEVYEEDEESYYEEEVYEVVYEDVADDAAAATVAASMVDDIEELGEIIYEEEIYDLEDDPNAEIYLTGTYTEEPYDEDLEYIEEEEEDAPDALSVFTGHNMEGNFFERICTFFVNMSMIDRIVASTGIIVLVLAIITVSVYGSAKLVDKQVAAFADVGSQLDSIAVIGEGGLLAVTDAELARLNAANMNEEDDYNYDEEEYEKEVTVQMNTTSIQKDLKIKFVNARTNKLIGNVPFKVEVTSPDKEKVTWTDDDMDGIIYKKDIVSGNYTLAMKELVGYDDYIISTESKKVTVKKNIDYEKVDVDDEVKTEAEVDAAKEDTKENDTEQESALKDTVTWVESTKTSTGDIYTEVAKSDIPNPLTSASLGSRVVEGSLVSLASTPASIHTGMLNTIKTEVSDGNEKVLTSIAVSLNASALTLKVGETATLAPVVTGTYSDGTSQTITDAVLQWGSTNETAATVSGGTVTAVASGEATISVIATSGTLSATATCAVTVSAPVEDTPQEPEKETISVEISPSALTVEKDKTGTLSVAVSGTTSDYTVNWTTKDSSIATIDSNGVVTGVKVGSTEAIVTISGSTFDTVSKSCAITVIEPTVSVSLQLDKSNLNIGVNQESTLKATLTGATGTLTWSSSDTKIATVTDKGKVKGIAAGDAVITVTYKEGDTTYSATCNVKVTAGVTISFAKSSYTKKAGETLDLSKQLTVTNGTSAGKVTYKSSDSAIVSVKDGVATAVKEGSAKITATYTEGELSMSAECTVTVEKKEDDSASKAKLKDKNGRQMYILNGDKYVEATAADYATADRFFYKTTGYKYTGWQTIGGKVYFYDINNNYVTGEQVIQGAKYNFGTDGALIVNSSTGITGIDVSKWNGSIDWAAVKNSGISYVIIRCGYRGSSTGALIEDPKFKANIQGATGAGLKVGVYFFTQAMDEREAVEEASMVLGLISKYNITYPVFLDVESSGGRADGIDKATRTAVCKAFCQTIQNSGYTAGIYANKTWFTEKMDASQLSAYKIWLAQYAAAPTYTGRYDMWQYSSKGKVSGISGNVDMNLSYMGY